MEEQSDSCHQSSCLSLNQELLSLPWHYDSQHLPVITIELSPWVLLRVWLWSYVVTFHTITFSESGTNSILPFHYLVWCPGVHSAAWGDSLTGMGYHQQLLVCNNSSCPQFVGLPHLESSLVPFGSPLKSWVQNQNLPLLYGCPKLEKKNFLHSQPNLVP